MVISSGGDSDGILIGSLSVVVVFNHFDDLSLGELGNHGCFSMVVVGSMALTSIIWVELILGGISDAPI